MDVKKGAFDGVADEKSFVSLLITDGAGTLTCGGETVKVKKGEVYEFDGSLAETVPTAAIEAEKGGMAARKVLTYDGRDGKTDYVLKSEPLLFDEAVG